MALIARVFNPAPAVILGVVGMFTLTYASIWLFAARGLWLEPVTAVAGIGLTTLAGSTLMYFLEHRERMVVRRQLARHVGEGVASQLDEGEWPERGGEAVEITVMFSDLQGFTTLSETLSSPEMCALLNRYFGDILFSQVDRFGGSTDKLMGDGMMAYFGWPIRHKDHAARAVQCALEIERELVKWLALPENAGLPPLRTRIGLHSGVATVGEIGSGKRVEFTVIGDVVNTSARLEGMNKDYGSVILMTEPTYAAAGSFGVKVEPRGPVPVRGKGQLVDVFSIQLEDITSVSTPTDRS
jgi:adenylate cyclase